MTLSWHTPTCPKLTVFHHQLGKPPSKKHWVGTAKTWSPFWGTFSNWSRSTVFSCISVSWKWTSIDHQWYWVSKSTSMGSCLEKAPVKVMVYIRTIHHFPEHLWAARPMSNVKCWILSLFVTLMSTLSACFPLPLEIIIKIEENFKRTNNWSALKLPNSKWNLLNQTCSSALEHLIVQDSEFDF